MRTWYASFLATIRLKNWQKPHVDAHEHIFFARKLAFMIYKNPKTFQCTSISSICFRILRSKILWRQKQVDSWTHKTTLELLGNRFFSFSFKVHFNILRISKQSHVYTRKIYHFAVSFIASYECCLNWPDVS